METFLQKAMNKLNPDKDKPVAPIIKTESSVPEKKPSEKTVIPTNKSKIAYKQQTLNSIANTGVMNNGKE